LNKTIMKMNKISIIIWSTLFAISVNGQVRQPHSLYFMETIPQISQMNPAFQPRANGYVALPVNFNIDLSLGFAVRDFIQKQGTKQKWDLPVEKPFDYDKLRKSIGKNSSMINFGLDLDIIGFGFRAGTGYFSFGISEHVSLNASLPNDVFNITEKGFPAGTTLDFSSLLNTRVMGYMQVLIGYSGKVNDKLTLGMNIKPMFGHAAIVPKTKNFKITTGGESFEPWKLNLKSDIYTSGPIDEVVTNEDGNIEKIVFKDFSDYNPVDWINNYVLGFNNPGIALDLGAEYKINERITVSASLNNLGFISWNSDLNSTPINGNYEFNGLEWDVSVTDPKDFKDLYKMLGDSILAAVTYPAKHDKFKTMLPPVLYAGGSYNLTQTISVGLLSRTAFWNNGVCQSFNASVYLQPYSFVAMNLGVNYQVKGSVHLGGGFTIFGGPLQLYLLIDNVPIYYSTLKVNDEKIMLTDKMPFPFPERLKTLTLRVGLNLVFGKHGYINRPMLDKGRNSWH